ncbi:MAG TPA: hypothetical protein VIH82_12020 [Acidimicrobiia bacterium]
MTPAAPAALPRRDPETRARLREIAGRSRPVTLAREQSLTVTGRLGEALPLGALQRGTVVAVDGARGAGATSVAFSLVAAVTATGEWAAAVELEGTLGLEAAARAGVALERFAVVRCGSRDRWATTVATLLDGVTLVLAEVPPHARAGDVRRLVARARERGAVLVALPAPGARWPGDATLRLVAAGGCWPGLARGGGLLEERVLRLTISGKGAAARAHEAELARAG